MSLSLQSTRFFGWRSCWVVLQDGVLSWYSKQWVFLSLSLHIHKHAGLKNVYCLRFRAKEISSYEAETVILIMPLSISGLKVGNTKQWADYYKLAWRDVSWNLFYKTAHNCRWISAHTHLHRSKTRAPDCCVQYTVNMILFILIDLSCFSSDFRSDAASNSQSKGCKALTQAQCSVRSII